MATVEEALDSAVKAIERGDMGEGRTTLKWVLTQDPSNRLAWLWMACCIGNERAREECYVRASAVPN